MGILPEDIFGNIVSYCGPYTVTMLGILSKKYCFEFSWKHMQRISDQDFTNRCFDGNQEKRWLRTLHANAATLSSVNTIEWTSRLKCDAELYELRSAIVLSLGYQLRQLRFRFDALTTSPWEIVSRISGSNIEHIHLEGVQSASALAFLAYRGIPNIKSLTVTDDNQEQVFQLFNALGGNTKSLERITVRLDAPFTESIDESAFYAIRNATASNTRLKTLDLWVSDRTEWPKWLFPTFHIDETFDYSNWRKLTDSATETFGVPLAVLRFGGRSMWHYIPFSSQTNLDDFVGLFATCYPESIISPAERAEALALLPAQFLDSETLIPQHLLAWMCSEFKKIVLELAGYCYAEVRVVAAAGELASAQLRHSMADAAEMMHFFSSFLTFNNNFEQVIERYGFIAALAVAQLITTSPAWAETKIVEPILNGSFYGNYIWALLQPYAECVLELLKHSIISRDPFAFNLPVQGQLRSTQALPTALLSAALLPFAFRTNPTKLIEYLIQLHESCNTIQSASVALSGGFRVDVFWQVISSEEVNVDTFTRLVTGWDMLVSEWAARMCHNYCGQLWPWLVFLSKKTNIDGVDPNVMARQIWDIVKVCAPERAELDKLLSCNCGKGGGSCDEAVKQMLSLVAHYRELDVNP